MNNIITTAFDAAMKKHGFIKQSGTWYCHSPETISVVNLQKSDYSPMYYVNLAVWCKALGDAVAPKEEHCPLRLRLSALADSSICRAFDMTEIDLTNESRSQIIADCVNDVIVPFLRSLETTSQIKQVITDGKIPGIMVYKKLKEFLGITS